MSYVEIIKLSKLPKLHAFAVSRKLRKYRCGLCKVVGHNRRKCPQKEVKDVKNVKEVKELTNVKITATMDIYYPDVVRIATMDVYYPDVVKIDKFVPRAIDPDLREDPKNPECAICLEPLSSDVVNETVCKHRFHQLCIWQWLMIRSDCPWCRTILGINELHAIN